MTIYNSSPEKCNTLFQTNLGRLRNSTFTSHNKIRLRSSSAEPQPWPALLDLEPLIIELAFEQGDVRPQDVCPSTDLSSLFISSTSARSSPIAMSSPARSRSRLSISAAVQQLFARGVTLGADFL
jgi:hypothetical protein